MKILLYSKIREENIAEHLGLPEYSYYFVFKEFYRVLKKQDIDVVVLDEIVDADRYYEQSQVAGEDCRLILFTPPHKYGVRPKCPTYLLFAWEFDTLPDGSWSSDPDDDWVSVLARFDGAITLSQHSSAVVKKALGESYSVTAIPVPVASKFQAQAERCQENRGSAHSRLSLEVSGSVIDTCGYIITPDTFIVDDAMSNFSFPVWDGAPLEMPVTYHDPYNSFLVGFYPPELWGMWSRISNPSFIIPYKLHGRVRMIFECAGYHTCANQEIRISIGGDTQPLQLTPHFTNVAVEFNLREPASLLRFIGIDNRPVPGALDRRSMGIGLKSVKVERIGEADVVNMALAEPVKVDVEGVIYTSVFNPVDDRKNWVDIVSAFVCEFRDNEEVVLVLKMTHRKLSKFLGRLHYLLQRLSPFKCRVVAVHGFLDEKSFNGLIEATHYYVNASAAEGLCLPLMEYMSSSKPAIAPIHTALEDYVDEASCFIVRSSPEPTYWPPDSSERYRATQYRVDWSSLQEQFRQSYDCLIKTPVKYTEKGVQASEKLRSFSSDQSVINKLADFLGINMLEKS